ncbi:ABC transporter permease [Boseaceae bacterium BT-24-1]|nr:ABC transporter permease [Boseaceae bacterium BT-24-1]
MSLSRAQAWPLLMCVPAVALFAVFFLLPLALVMMLSAYSFKAGVGIVPDLSWANYAAVIFDGYYQQLFFNTLFIGVTTALVTLLLGMPEAYVLYRMRSPWRTIFLLVILGPLLISLVVRTLGWLILLGNQGVLNSALMAAGVTEDPIRFLYSAPAIVIGLTHVLLPFMVIPIWTSLQKQKSSVVHAAFSLGASRRQVFFRIILPTALPGILSGTMVVFSLAASAFATPAILGGRRFKVVSTAVYDEFMSTLNWPLGATIALFLLIISLGSLMLYNRLIERRIQRWA